MKLTARNVICLEPLESFGNLSGISLAQPAFLVALRSNNPSISFERLESSQLPLHAFSHQKRSVVFFLADKLAVWSKMSRIAVSSCSIDGNPDLYGLGIRLGIYFQIVATILVNNFVPDEVSGTWDMNAISILAVFAAVNHAIHYVEAFVMLQLIFGYLLASSRTRSPII